MSDWFFEKNGERGGPVSADELKAMVSSGAISLTNLVWTAAFGSEWRRLGDTELAPPQPILPPPLPPNEPPALPSKPEQAAFEPNDFLYSELTKALIGRKQEHHLAKWRAILAKAGGDPANIATTSSWNWPALFLPYGWLLYRRMYVLGGIVLAVQLAYVLLPDSVPTSVARAFLFATFGLGIVFALYGNAWYLDVVRKRWEALRQEQDQAAALARAKQTGGVNLVAPIVAFALVIAAAVVPHLNLPSWGGSVALVRDGYMTGYSSTTIGKALAASFDNAEWQSFTSDKGATVVKFTGNINASLHANAIEQLMRPVNQAADDNDINARYGSYDTLLPYYQTAIEHLKARNRLQPIADKHGCGHQATLASCDALRATFTLMREVVETWAEDAYWPVGEPVEIQWTLNPDGRSFSLASMNSNAWKGKPFSDIFAVLYD
ncbi:GYF domain-containing protein [Bosea sp. TWI1241]|uniref:GYF domain-containing protein n=1 Tax=Bosea sp. TWI1241 TaxID=3148904 RepID=UPI00320B3D1C